MTAAPSPRASPAPHAVSLRPLALTDALNIRRWMADLDVIKFTVVVPGPEYGVIEPYPPAEADRYLHALVHDRSRRSFAILLDGVHVGNIGLKDYSPSATTAECFVEIGDKTLRGRGVGMAAMELLLEYAFERLGLATIRLGVFEFNTPALRLYRKLGFADDGRYGGHFTDGRMWEVKAMSLDVASWIAHRGTGGGTG